ncbi:MAG TPA: DUF4236 domain-containing protein [Dehalococcoidia bacterium]|jgi:hypothetical protein|nr:DUF4236 domain-containing protein [Dehalococcoidia bacterium]
MGWFLRKSVRLGPLRLNLSKRGIGASVGVKGLRTGIDASGKPYVAGGRGGFYFRERLRVREPGPGFPEVRRDPSRGVPPSDGSRSLGWIVAAILAVIVMVLLAAR